MNQPQVLAEKNPWILSARWDLFFLIGSALLVPLPLLIKNGLGLSVTLVNLAVTILIGGPHLFATFTYTLMEKSFWQRHRFYAAGALLIPPLVITLGLKAFGVLIGIFFFWASVHILHQVCYIVDCYRTKSPQPTSKWDRAIDYLVVMTSIYPIASYKLVYGNFYIAGKSLIIPFVYNNPPIFIIASALFVGGLVLFIGKTILQQYNGTLNFPKTLIISVTALVSFLIPYPHDLDVSFQGFNTWHSLQYFALAWWINVLRKGKEEISSPFVQKISGKKRTPLFYVSCLVPTLAFLALIAYLGRMSGLPFNQCYFIVVLSGLLMHYYFDHWVFTQPSSVIS